MLLKWCYLKTIHTTEAIETSAFLAKVLKGFPAIAIATDWLMGVMLSGSSSGPPDLPLPPRESDTVKTTHILTHTFKTQI